MSQKSETRVKGNPRRQVMTKRSVIVERKVTWLTKRGIRARLEGDSPRYGRERAEKGKSRNKFGSKQELLALLGREREGVSYRG